MNMFGISETLIKKFQISNERLMGFF